MNRNVISNTVIFEFKSKTNTTDYAYKRLEIDDLLLTTNLEDEAASVEVELQQDKKTDNTLGKEVTKIGCFTFEPNIFGQRCLGQIYYKVTFGPKSF